MPTTAELAEMAFDARVRVAALEMQNVPTDYDVAKKAFVELTLARESAARANKALEDAINN